MKNIKVLLSDPRHDTVGTHSSYIPINIAYIAAYLKHNIKDFKKYFKNIKFLFI